MSSIYSHLKILRFQDKILSLPEEQPILAPLHVRLKPTNVCNHRCAYCAYRVGELQLGQDMDPRQVMPTPKLLEIVQDIVEMGIKAVTFSGGGEPLCHPGIAQAMRALAKGGVGLASLTNGSLLRGEVAEILAFHGVWVRISMDGYDAQSYARYRGTGVDEFARVMANIEGFKRLAGTCRLGVSLILDEHNKGEVFAMLARLKDAGADSVKVSPCIVSNDASSNNSYHRPFFAVVREGIDQARKTLAGEAFEIFDAYHELDEKFTKDYSWCPYAQILPVIGADARVYTCQDKAYNLRHGAMGSLEGVRFKDFWFSDKSRFFAVNPACVCNHHCVANLKNRLIHEFLGLSPDHLAFV